MSSGTRAALVIGIFCALATGASAADYGKDAKKTDGRKGGLSVSVEAGLGYDSNVFLTPENPYVDLSLLVPVTITPDKQTGFFVPLGLDAEYLRPMGTGARLLSDFGFDGQIYEPDIDNANLYDAEFTLGPEFGLTKNSSLYAGIILGDYMKFGGSLDYALAKSTKVSAGYKYTVRDYNDRKARDLGGNLLASNPQLEYTYHTIDLTLRQRVSDSLVAYVDYTRQDRKDEFVGYNDYGQNRYKVRAIYTPTEELRVRVAASYWDREYDRAFAFDDPAGGKKDYSGITFDAGVDYGYSKQVSFWADLNYDSQDTTDKRYEYDRTQLSAGVKYEF